MKLLSIKKSNLLLFVASLAVTFAMNAQVGGWKPDLSKDSKAAIENLKKDNPSIVSYYDKAYGFAVFPKVTKAGLVIGGAGAKGIVFKNKVPVGSSKLKQASVGLQAGAQQYSEVIFFENKKAFENFTNGKLKFDGQATAVAIKKGVALDIAYEDGVAVFTKAIGGLMFEASLGGQHFTYEAKK